MPENLPRILEGEVVPMEVQPGIQHIDGIQQVAVEGRLQGQEPGADAAARIAEAELRQSEIAAAERRSRRRWTAVGVGATLLAASPFIITKAGDFAGDTARNQVVDWVGAAANGVKNLFASGTPPLTGVVNSEAVVKSITYPAQERPLVRADVAATSSVVAQNHAGFIPVVGSGYTMVTVGTGKEVLKVPDMSRAFKTSVETSTTTAADGTKTQSEHLKTVVQAAELRTTLEDYDSDTTVDDHKLTDAGNLLGGSSDDRRKNMELHNKGLMRSCGGVLLANADLGVEKVVDAQLLSADVLGAKTPEEQKRLKELTDEPMDVVFVDAAGREVLPTSLVVPTTGETGIDSPELAKRLKIDLQEISNPTPECSVATSALPSLGGAAQ